MRNGGKSLVTYMGDPPQLVTMKAKLTSTYAKVTQHSSGKLKSTHIRNSEGAWTQIEDVCRMDSSKKVCVE